MNRTQHQIRLVDEWIPTQLDPIEDGAHELAGNRFFEWWYFDARFDNGYHLVVALHSRLFNVSSRPAVIAAHLYGPGDGRTVEVAAFHPTETASAVEQCDVRLGSSRVWDEGNHYQLHIQQGSIRAELKYQKEIEGVRAGTGVLVVDPITEQSFHWIVPLPRARVSGYLWIDEERTAVRGTGYHDHNWGNLDLHRVLRRWRWGHVTTNDHTLMFWDIHGREAASSHITGAMLWKGSELSLNTNQVKLHSGKSVIFPERDTFYLDCIEVQVDEGQPVVETILQNQRALDQIDFVQPQSSRETVRRILENLYFFSERVPLIGQLVKRWIGCGTYHRFQAECKFRIGLEYYSGRVFYEFMDFGDLD